MGLLWTYEEIEYLKDNVGKIKLSTIATNLGKTNTAVLLKIKKLNLGNTKENTGLITLNGLANILNVDRATVKGWADRHSLPFKKSITREKRHFHLIHPEEFWNWAYLNKGKVQFMNVERNVLAPEPEWVEEERRKEMQSLVKKKRSYQTWTTSADRQLIYYRNKGLTYREIGERLHRTPISVERRYQRIKRSSMD